MSESASADSDSDGVESDAIPVTLKGRHTAVFGLKGTGKSNWVQYALSQPEYRANLVYDVCREHEADGINRYLPEHRRGSDAEEELDYVLSEHVTDISRNRRPEIVAVEEVSRFCSSHREPPESLLELVDLGRHYGTGLIAVARRPASVYADLVELADRLIIFRLTGKNDYRRLEAEVEGLGDAVRELDDYHYVMVEPDRSYHVMEPVEEMDTTGSL